MHDQAPEIDPQNKGQQIARTLEQDRSNRWWRYLLAALVLAGIAGAAVWWLVPREQPRSWVTEAVGRGDMTLTATATGDLQPKRTVTIGAEISGMIDTVEVEANERVEKGQVLLRFNPETLENELAQATASLTSARAGQRRAQATLDAAKLEFARIQKLAAKKMASESELDEKKAAQLRAVADLESARASVARARAELSAAETRLSKATITSPISGVVLARNVEGGNTVTSTLQTPELFVLAEDLSQMELHVSIDEADIGLVEPGQKASFDVDAWPDRTFDATVKTVSLSPAITDNVVTYTAVLTVDNSGGLLRPGMTATATITTGVREDVLRVPNVALRFAPPSDDEEKGPSLVPTRGWGGRDGAATPGNRLWVLQNGQPTPIRVRLGRSDGRYTEIADGDLSENDRVIVAVRSGEAAGETRPGSNPSDQPTQPTPRRGAQR